MSQPQPGRLAARPGLWLRNRWEGPFFWSVCSLSDPAGVPPVNLPSPWKPVCVFSLWSCPRGGGQVHPIRPEGPARKGSEEGLRVHSPFPATSCGTPGLSRPIFAGCLCVPVPRSVLVSSQGQRPIRLGPCPTQPLPCPWMGSGGQKGAAAAGSHLFWAQPGSK